MMSMNARIPWFKEDRALDTLLILFYHRRCYVEPFALLFCLTSSQHPFRINW